MMVHNPAFAAIAVLTLAIGIGQHCNLHAVKPILIVRCLSARQPPHAAVEMRKNGAPMPVTFGTFQGLSQRTQSFDALAVSSLATRRDCTSQGDRPDASPASA